MSEKAQAVRTPKIPFDLSQFDLKEYTLNDYKIKVYNSSTLENYLSKFNVDQTSDNIIEIPLNILYVIHGRGSNHFYSEAYGSYLVSEYYKKKNPDIPLLFVAFDLPNHGFRYANDKPREYYDNSETYPFDLVHTLESSVSLLKTVMEFLPFYLNLDQYVPKLRDYKFIYHNIVSGMSLGGHITHRFLTRYPGLVDIAFPIVGSTDISSLLIDRLHEQEHQGAKRYLQEYSELGFNDKQKKLYPKQFHDYLRAIDEQVFDKFPVGKVKLFAAYGEQDKLVPPVYSKLFIQLQKLQDPDNDYFVQEDAGHEVTKEMIDKFVEWVVKFI